MRSEQFQRFLNDIPLLTTKQRIILAEDLAQQDSSNTLEQVIERRFYEHPVCPLYKSENIHQWGIRNQRQRYHCKDCNNTFNAFSKTSLTRLQHPEKWNRYLESMTQSTTLRPIAKACRITLKTSFNWRHGFPEVLEDGQSNEPGEIIELDETLFRESFKGQKKDLSRSAINEVGVRKMIEVFQNTETQRIHGKVTGFYGKNTEQPYFSCDLLSFPAGGVVTEAPDEPFPTQGKDLYGWFEGITGATENDCG